MTNSWTDIKNTDLVVVMGIAIVSARHIDVRSRRALYFLILAQLLYVGGDLLYGAVVGD